MLFKFIFITGLAWGALGSSVFDINAFEVVGKNFCKANNAANKWPEIEKAHQNYGACVSTVFDKKTMREIYKNASSDADFDRIAKTMSSRGPALKTCVHQLVTNMAACLLASEAQAAERDASEVISYFFEYDGAKLATFYKEGGLECTSHNDAWEDCRTAMEANAAKIAERYGGGAEAIYSSTKEERCSIQDETAACYVALWKSCPKPAMGTLAEELRKKMPACENRSFIFTFILSI